MSSQKISEEEERKLFVTAMGNENEIKAGASPTEEKNKSFELGASDSGKIYALKSSTTKLERLSTVTATWESSLHLEDADDIYGLVALDNQLYIAEESTVRLYTGLSVPASVKAKLNQRRRFFGFCAHKDIIVAVGGIDSQFDGLKSAEFYTPALNAWKTFSEMIIPRASFTVVSCAEFVYALGGLSGSSYYVGVAETDSVERCDPGKGEWQLRAPLKIKRSGHGAVAYEDRIFVIGGRSRFGTPLSSGEIYDCNTGQTTYMAPMRIARVNFGIAIHHTKIYCVGGYGTTKHVGPPSTRHRHKKLYRPLQSTEVYDILTNSWEEGGDTVSISGYMFCTTLY